MVVSILWGKTSNHPELQQDVISSQSTYIVAQEQPFSEKPLNQLFSENIAIPVQIAGELPSFHPHQSKSKHILTTNRPNRFNLHTAEVGHSAFYRYHHVIDYYIYTLEHILI